MHVMSMACDSDRLDMFFWDLLKIWNCILHIQRRCKVKIDKGGGKEVEERYWFDKSKACGGVACKNWCLENSFVNTYKMCACMANIRKTNSSQFCIFECNQN